MKDIALQFFSKADIFPRFAPAGYTEIGNPGWAYMDRKPQTQQVIGSITRISGGHNLKIGGEYRRNSLAYLQPNNPQGSFSFSRQTTTEDLYTSSSGPGQRVCLDAARMGRRRQYRPHAHVLQQ